MSDCLFCKIASGEIPSKKVYEDDLICAFYDINPAAPLHFLVIPKKHIESIADVAPGDAPLVGHIFEVIARLSSDMGFRDGFRVVSNTGQSAGQSVKHLHFHVLSGRDMTWPPG